MKSVKQILIPTDFSDNATKSYPFAMEMALKYKADITFLLVLEKPYNFTSRAEQNLASLTEGAQKMLNELTEEWSNNSRFSGIHIDTKIVTGKVVPQILNVSSEINADLIVLANKGVTGLKKILFGSTASALIAETNTPTLAIPEAAKYDEFKNVVFVTEYNDNDIELLKTAFNFSEFLDSNFEILHINDLSDLKSESLFHGFNHIAEKTLKSKDLIFRVSNNSDLSDSVEEYEEEERPSVVILGNNSKGIFQRFLDSTEANQVENISKTPVLVLPDKI